MAATDDRWRSSCPHKKTAALSIRQKQGTRVERYLRNLARVKKGARGRKKGHGTDQVEASRGCAVDVDAGKERPVRQGLVVVLGR